MLYQLILLTSTAEIGAVMKVRLNEETCLNGNSLHQSVLMRLHN